MAGLEDLASVDDICLGYRAFVQKVKVGRQEVFAAPWTRATIPVLVEVMHFGMICIVLGWVAA